MSNASAWSENVTVASVPSLTVAPVSLAVGETLTTVTVALYSRRPPSLSVIAALTGIVAGPSVAGSVTLAPPGLKPVPSRSYA